MNLVPVETIVYLKTQHVLGLKVQLQIVLLIATLPVHHGVLHLILALDALVRHRYM